MTECLPDLHLPPDYQRIRVVGSFAELVATPFASGVNAVCWPRVLSGDFGEIVSQIAPGEGIENLSDDRLLSLRLSPAGKVARDHVLSDLRLLREAGFAPEFNSINSYPHDEEGAPVATDVYSFHADSAPVAAETWLCTYHGASSEGLRNEDAHKRIDIPETRAALLRIHSGLDDAEFRTLLQENCYDLHYACLPGAQPYSFGLHNLWRIAVDHPESAVPPCIHRAPLTRPGAPPRLLLIS